MPLPRQQEYKKLGFHHCPLPKIKQQLQKLKQASKNQLNLHFLVIKSKYFDTSSRQLARICDEIINWIRTKYSPMAM